MKILMMDRCIKRGHGWTDGRQKLRALVICNAVNMLLLINCLLLLRICVFVLSLFSGAVSDVLSSCAITLRRKTKLVALL